MPESYSNSDREVEVGMHYQPHRDSVIPEIEAANNGRRMSLKGLPTSQCNRSAFYYLGEFGIP